MRRVSTLLAALCVCCGSNDDEGSAATTSSAPNVVVDDTLSVDCGVPWPAESAQLEQEVFDLVNQVRMTGTQCGSDARPPVPPLELNAVLVCTARLHSKDMGDQGYFEHVGLDGRDPFKRMTDAGYQWSAAAENIAEGQPTAEEVMQTWLQSPDHCANIMGDYVHIGIGYYLGARPVWTQNFGSPAP